MPNAAANPYHGGLAGIPDSAFDKIMETNVRATFWLCRLVLPHMVERGEGSITIIASIAGLKGSPDLGAYAMSKVAGHQLARNLAVEYGPHGIRINAIAPGLIKTDFAKALWTDPERLEVVSEPTPPAADRRPVGGGRGGPVPREPGRLLCHRPGAERVRWSRGGMRGGSGGRSGVAAGGAGVER